MKRYELKDHQSGKFLNIVILNGMLHIGLYLLVDF